jgi:hypothetical protein
VENKATILKLKVDLGLDATDRSSLERLLTERVHARSAQVPRDTSDIDNQIQALVAKARDKSPVDWSQFQVHLPYMKPDSQRELAVG